jgi:hypothetical protein
LESLSRFAREGRDASLIQERQRAIAVLAIKAKPPSAVASRALTVALGNGVWPPCLFGD